MSVTMVVTGATVTGNTNGTATGTTNQYKFIAFPTSTPRGLQLTFTGLDAGKQYRFQFGYGDKRTDVAYKESVTLTLSDSSSAVVPLAYGSPAVGDEYALLTAIVTNTTSLVLDLPQTVLGNHGPSQAGFSVAVSPLDAPAGLVATPAPGQVGLNWTASFGATGYKVWTSNSVTHAVVIDTTAGAPFTKTSLNVGTEYFFMVTATNSVAESGYSAQVSATPTAEKGNQIITFALGTEVTKSFTNAPFADTATASSGLPVTYSSDNPSVATVDASGTVTIVTAGTAHILADQAGDANWNPAQASQTLTVNKVDQTITFTLGLAVSKLSTSAPFADTATASSGLPITYSSDNPSVATVNANNGTVTIVAEGTANILANQVGNANWNPAPQASQTLTVGNIASTTQNSANPIVFDNTQTLVGAAVFGNPGTYDGIPFSLWSTPFTTTTLSLGEGVSVTMAIDSGSGGVTGPTTLGTTNQYQYGAFPNNTFTGMTLTFTGLDAGKQYLFQFGYGDKRTIFDYNESVVLTLSDGTTTVTPLAFGSAAVGDEYALLTAIATNTTSLVLYLPSTHAGYHGITQAGFSVHRFGAPAAPTPVITSFTGPVAGYFTILGTSSGAGNLVTLMATNLASPVVWTPIQTNAVSSGPISILVPQGTQPAAYYRLMGQ